MRWVVTDKDIILITNFGGSITEKKEKRGEASYERVLNSRRAEIPQKGKFLIILLELNNLFVSPPTLSRFQRRGSIL